MEALNQVLKKKVTKRVARLELATTSQQGAQQVSEPGVLGEGKRGGLCTLVVSVKHI